MLEAFIVSTNYSDLLDITLPANKDKVDRLVVATSEHDKATISICHKHKIEILLCDEELSQNGTKFNRGAVYNKIFNSHSQGKDWILLLDSDILIPKINTRNLSPELFYGSRRWNLETYADYQRILKHPEALNQDNFILFRGGGYGYFQLFNYNSKTFQKILPKPYREQSGIAEHDWIFRNNWGRELFWPHIMSLEDHKIKHNQDIGLQLFRFLPENCIHLGITGKNDTERKTPKFTNE